MFYSTSQTIERTSKHTRNVSDTKLQRKANAKARKLERKVNRFAKFA